MTVILAKRIEKDFLEAAVNVLPTDPHEMTTQIYNVDYSSLRNQLRAIPSLKDADFQFGDEVCSLSLLNSAVIQNPTKQMVIDLFRQGRPEDFEKLRADFHSAEWDYSNALYRWNPNQNIFYLEKKNRFPEYPPEIKLEEAIESATEPYKGLLRDSSGEYFMHARKIIQKECLPSNKVVITRTNVSVTYGIREPSYLPALVKALGGSGALTIQRNL